jgi:hypothetical protein
MKAIPIRGSRSNHQASSSITSGAMSSVTSISSASAATATPVGSRYAQSLGTASASASASASAAEETPPGSRDGTGIPPGTHFTANPNSHINLSAIAPARLASRTHSSGTHSLEGSDGALSASGEEYTTALPRFGEQERQREKERERERREGRGIRGVLPGFSKKKGKDKEEGSLREKVKKERKGEKDKGRVGGGGEDS